MIISKYNANQSMLSETESLESIDDKLWMHYEQELELDKKSNGQLKNDCIVSTSISFGGEHEYLLIMVHEFNINENLPIKHPIILMVDLRNINFNVNYNNSDTNNNNRNLLNIKFFHGFQQNRFKLQCGFGGFQLPPLSNKSNIYQQSKYQYNQQLKKNKIRKQSLLKQKQQSKLKKKLNLSSSVSYNGHHSSSSPLFTNKEKQQKQELNQQQEAIYNNNNNNNYMYPYALNNNELRNLRIPFSQSLQNSELSDLQNHINENVDYHYQGLASFNNDKDRKRNENVNKKQKNKSCKNKSRINSRINENEIERMDDDDNKETLSPSLMIEECIKIALKYPEFLPSKLIDDKGCDINESIKDRKKYGPIIRSLFTTLPFPILNKLYKFMQTKMSTIQKKHAQSQHITIKRGGKIGRNDLTLNHNIGNNENGVEWTKINQEKSKSNTKRRLLQKEISNAFKYCGKGKIINNQNTATNLAEYEQLDSSSSTAISSGSLNSLSHSLNNKYLLSPTSDNYNSIDNIQNRSMSSLSSTLSHSILGSHYIFDDTRYNPQNLKKKCGQLKEKRDKLTNDKQKSKNNNNNNNNNYNINYEDNNGRSHYLFQKYIRSQIVNDDSDLKYFSKNIDKLLTKYNDIDNDKWTHLAMEMKYFLWHKHLKQQHFNKMKQEHYHKISKKKKKKKLKKLQAMNVESKLKYAIKKKKKIEKRNKNRFNDSYSKFLDPNNKSNNKRKSKMKRRHKLDKSRRSNEDIQISPKPSNNNNNKDGKNNDDEKGQNDIDSDNVFDINDNNHNNNNHNNDLNKNIRKQSKNKFMIYTDDDSELSSNNDSDIDEYVAVQNTQFLNDEFNEINVDLCCGYNKNQSLNKLNLNEMSSISQLIHNKRNNKNDIDILMEHHNEIMNKNKNTLIQDEYITNDFFGGHHFIISGSEDGNVCIWNRITQKIIKLSGHKKSVNCVTWNPVDSFILVSGSDDCSIRVWGPNAKKNNFNF